MSNTFKSAVIFLFISLIYTAFSQDNPDLKPQVTDKVSFTFPEFKEVKLDNGFRVFLIEDNRQPVIAFRFLVKINYEQDRNNRVIAELVSKMIEKRLSGKGRDDVAKLLGKTGAIINVESNSDYLTVNCLVLNKYTEEVVKLLSEIVTKPEFNSNDLPGSIAALTASQTAALSNPEAIAEALANRVLLGVRISPDDDCEALKAIKINELTEFCKKHFTPQNVTLAVVGSYKEEELNKLLAASLKNWKQGKVVESSQPAYEPLPPGIYYIPRPESVQSYIMFARRAPGVSSSKFECLNILTDIAGARLFEALREKNNIAYSAKGFITGYSDANYMAFTTSTATGNTSKALTIIENILRGTATSEISANEVRNSVVYAVNRHNMSFDRKEYIANFIQDCLFYGMSKDAVRGYTQGLNSILPYDINQLAAEYLSTEKMYIFVVGNPELKQELEKFATVYEYNTSLYAVEGSDAKLGKVSLSPQELIEKYVKATGGREAMASVTTILDSASAKMILGREVIDGVYKIYRKTPDMFKSALECGSFDITLWSDGTRVWIKSNSYLEQLNAEESSKLNLTTKMFAYARLPELGYKCRILGESNNLILMEVISKFGTKSIYYFDADSYLLKRIETMENGSKPTLVTESYDKYKEYNGLMLPTIIETETPVYKLKTVHNYMINIPFGPEIEFNPALD